MVLLTRKKQLAGVLQSDDTVASDGDLTTADNADSIVLDLEANLDVERVERNLIRDSITAVKDLAGQKAVDMTFGIEMLGRGAFSNGAPKWTRYLKASGFKEHTVNSLTIGAITAGGGASETSTTFRHGETITGSSSAATATVVGDTHNGQTVIYYDQDTLSGTFTTSDTISGGDSGAEADVSSVNDDQGFAWSPVTDVTKSITFDGSAGNPLSSNLSVGDIIEGQTSGAVGIVAKAATAGNDVVVTYRPQRGTFDDAETVDRIAPTATTDIGDTAADRRESFVDWAPITLRAYMDGKAITARSCRGSVAFDLQVNRQARMNFSFRGVLDSLEDEPLISGVQYDNTTPPLWESSTIGYAANDDADEADAADEVEPCLNAATFDMGVQLADRRCAGADNGLLEVRGAARDGTFSIDPEDTVEADIGWLSAVRDAGVFRLSATIGSTAGQQFRIQAPGLQLTEASSTDRDGIMALDISGRLTGGDLFDLDTSASDPQLSSIGGDNEVVLFYFSS